MNEHASTIALKEWAVAVKSLREGRQVLLVRKGGIREETREFRVRADRFALFPTYEHQRAELLQPAFVSDLEQVIDSRHQPDEILLDTWCELSDLFEVTEPWQLEAVAAHYCWSQRYVEERLRWRPRKPLLVMAVRAYRLARPVAMRVLPEHGGCKSWLELPIELDLTGMVPALDDATYRARIADVRAALGREPAAAVSLASEA